jgi:hypothetical protein
LSNLLSSWQAAFYFLENLTSTSAFHGLKFLLLPVVENLSSVTFYINYAKLEHKSGKSKIEPYSCFTLLLLHLSVPKSHFKTEK